MKRTAPVVQTEVAGLIEPLNRPEREAELLGVARSTLLGLVAREGLPAEVLSGGGDRRRILRFRHSDVVTWLAGRRERQIARTLDGERFARRRGIADEGGRS